MKKWINAKNSFFQRYLAHFWYFRTNEWMLTFPIENRLCIPVKRNIPTLIKRNKIESFKTKNTKNNEHEENEEHFAHYPFPFRDGWLQQY